MRYPASPRIRLFWLALVCLGAGLILYPSASVAESRAFRWQSLSMPSGGRVAALAMAPDDPNTLLAATDAGVYLSRDGGARWSENSRGLPTPDILTVAISPANPSYYYAGGLRGLFRSRDRGQTWERVGGRLAAETVTVVVPDPRDSKVLYAGTIRAFFKSSDGGDNWQALDQAVFSTTTIWTAAVVPAQPQVVYAGGDGSALYRSGDAGASWRVVNSGLPAGARVQHIAVHPQTPAILFAATTRGLFHSGDGGANWTAVGGSACQDAALSVEFDRLNPSTLYAGLGQGGVCRSVDNGETWTPA
ncbi:MAG: hypothetical protein HYR71_11165, partial [Chloroflexi bacterium]|nr:hypothetical protein [Chloroflexota bacterium]